MADITSTSAAANAEFLAILEDLLAKGNVTAGTVPAGLTAALVVLQKTINFGSSGAAVPTRYATVAAATAAGANVDGAGPIIITDARKPTEGGGAGTGSACFYWAAGPSGAGYYTTANTIVTE